MRPYGREKRVSQNPKWKRDHHLHNKGCKLANWWEGICECLSRTAIKRKVRQDIRNEIDEEKDQ